MNLRRMGRGFTLVEVLVALVVIAFGMGALLSTLTSAADNVAHLREKSLAEWIALNRISEMRLARGTKAAGKSNGEVEYAGGRWRWNATITAPETLAGLLVVEMAVSRVDPAAGEGDTDAAALATVWSLFGNSMSQPSGYAPTWSFASGAPGGPGGPGGPGQPGAPGQPGNSVVTK